MTHASLQILVDNRAENGLDKEHGLSMWIEVDGRRILFDTGTGKILESNARKLGVNIYSADLLALSHGHYDHTSGVSGFLKHNRHGHVFCHPGAVLPRYAIRNGSAVPIHMPHDSIAAVDKLSDSRLHWVQGPLDLSEHVGLTGHIPRKISFEDTGGPFYLDPAGDRPDPIDDDMALWIQTEKGLRHSRVPRRGREVAPVLTHLHTRSYADIPVAINLFRYNLTNLKKQSIFQD